MVCIIITEQVEQANKVFSVQRVTLWEVSTTNQSTTSYIYLRQLNSAWPLVVPDKVTHQQEKSSKIYTGLGNFWGN